MRSVLALVAASFLAAPAFAAPPSAAAFSARVEVCNLWGGRAERFTQVKMEFGKDRSYYPKQYDTADFQEIDRRMRDLVWGADPVTPQFARQQTFALCMDVMGRND